MSEEYHISLLKTDDIRLFKELYNAFYAVLFNYAVTITKEQTLAEDAVSEVFLKLWERRKDIVIEHSIKSYLFKSVYHQCLNTLKHTSVQHQYRDFFLYHLPINENGTDYPLENVMEHEINDILRRTIQKLPEQCRKIFIMSRIECKKHEIISQELGISINTVRTQIRRALEKLRVELKDFLPVFILFLSSQHLF